MGKEIERKYLIRPELLDLAGVEGMRITQGYLHTEEQFSIRVRIKDESACLTIKGKADGPVRSEFEYAIPKDEAKQLLEYGKGHIIEKMRYIIPYNGQHWEVDVFAGENLGLVIAELELEAIDQPIDLPDWVGEEVTEDERYYNPYLALHPYSTWKEVNYSDESR